MLFLEETSSSGLLTVSIVSGDVDEPTFYNTANAIGANLAIANGYTDITATANVIGNYANVTITTNNVSGTFTDGEEITQLATSARGRLASAITSGDDYIITLEDSEGIFKNGYGVTGATSTATATVIKTQIDVGADLAPGFYNVTLTVTDNDEATGTDTMFLAVAEPNPNASLDVASFRITKNKRSGRTTTEILGTINLTDLNVTNGGTVQSRITIELFGSLPGGGDLIMSEEATLTVTDTPKTLDIRK